MIVVQEAVWRPECVACIDLLDDVITVLQTGTTEPVGYEYDSEVEAAAAYKIIVTAWETQMAMINRIQ